MIRSVTAVASLFTLVLAAAPVRADVVYTNFNFDSEPLGGTPTTTTPNTDPFPQANVYAITGFPDSGPVTGTVTVQNVAGLSKAAVLNTTQGTLGSLYMDTQFLINEPFLKTSFDIAVISAPTSGLPQSATNIPNGQLFAVNAFALDSNRVFRVGASPTSATGGVYGVRNNTDGDLILFGTYTNGVADHIEVDANYLNNTVDVYLNNTLALSNVPFVNAEPVNGGLEELFFFLNGVEGQTTSVALDNIVVQTPEPASLAVLAPVAGLLLKRRRRA